jgi:Secretion system C-terminal sorting domain
MRITLSIICVLFFAFSAPKLFAQTSGRISVESEAYWQNTPSVAISRTNSQVIAVTAADDDCWDLGVPVYLTDNDGLSWNTHRLPLIFHWEPFVTLDPAIAASDSGMFYCCYLAVGSNNTSTISLFVASSPDCIHWNYAPPLGDTTGGGYGNQEIRPQVAVDNNPQSPHHGRVYVAWTHYDTTAALIGLRLAWSDDHAKTWSGISQIPAQGFPVQVHTGINGEVFLAYGGPDVNMLAVSADGGSTFVFDTIGSFIEYPNVPVSGLITQMMPGIKHGLPAFTSIAFAVDRANRLYAVNSTWKAWNSTDSSSALYYSTSDDLGKHWSDSLLLGAPSKENSDRWFPWLTSDPVTGEMSIVYYSSELDSGNISTTVFQSILGEGGPGLGVPLQAHLFNPFQCSANLQTSIGDYIGCDAYNGVFAAAWTTGQNDSVFIIQQGQDGSSDIMIYINAPNAGVHDDPQPGSSNIQIYPNPASSMLHVVSSYSDITITDLLGRTWLHRIDGSRDLDVSELPQGVYYISDGTSQTQFVKE